MFITLQNMVKLLWNMLRTFDPCLSQANLAISVSSTKTFKDGKWIRRVWVDSLDIPPLATEKS